MSTTPISRVYRLLNANWTITYGALISSALLVVLGCVSASVVRHLMATAYWEAHTREVIGDVQQLLRHVVTAESSQRRYVITGDLASRQVMSGEIDLVAKDMSGLLRLTADNPEQQQRIRHFQDLVEERFGFMREGVQVFEESGLPQAQEWFKLGKGQTAMHEAMDEARRVIQNEEDLLAIRHRQTERVGMAAMLCIVMVTVGGVCIGLIAHRVIRRSFAKRELLEKKLNDVNLDLERQIDERTSELRRQSLALAEANKELESFSYSVSHDLRAPLRTIGGYAQVLERKLAGIDADSLRRLKLISKSVTQMSQLITDLLTFSGIGRAEVSASTVDMNELVMECYESLQPMRAERTIRFSIANALPSCRADRGLLKQVMINLLANAIKYTGKTEAPEITVSWTAMGIPPGGDRAVGSYCVADNGAGFDMQYYDKLFGVFQRLHRSDEFEGTGVGLATVKRIVERHGGAIWATSAPGKGAAFFFTIATDRDYSI